MKLARARAVATPITGNVQSSSRSLEVEFEGDLSASDVSKTARTTPDRGRVIHPWSFWEQRAAESVAILRMLFG